MKRKPVLLSLTKTQVSTLREALDSSLYWEAPMHCRNQGFALDPREAPGFNQDEADTEEVEHIARIDDYRAVDRLLARAMRRAR